MCKITETDDCASVEWLLLIIFITINAWIGSYLIILNII